MKLGEEELKLVKKKYRCENIAEKIKSKCKNYEGE